MLLSQKVFEFRVFTLKYWLILNPFTTVVCVPKKFWRKFSSRHNTRNVSSVVESALIRLVMGIQMQLNGQLHATASTQTAEIATNVVMIIFSVVLSHDHLLSVFRYHASCYQLAVIRLASNDERRIFINCGWYR